MCQRALAFDDHPVGTLGGVAHHPLGGAGNEVGDDRVDADALACDRDAGLARRNEGRSLAGAFQSANDLERRGHLPDRRIASDGEHDPRTIAVPTVAADRKVGRRLAELTHRAAAALRGLREVRIREDALVQPVPYRQPPLERPRDKWPVRIRDAPARGRGPDEQDVGAERDRVVDGRDHRHAGADANVSRRIGPCLRRVDDRDDGIRRVAQDADRGLGRGRRELPLRQDRDLGGFAPQPPVHRPPRSRPWRRNRPARSRVVSPRSRATAPLTMTCSMPTG